jgi:hypothetical protein
MLKKYFTPGTTTIDGKVVPLKIPHPQTRNIVPEEGMWVADNPYWHRLVASGDGTLADTAPSGSDGAMAPAPEGPTTT